MNDEVFYREMRDVLGDVRQDGGAIDLESIQPDDNLFDLGLVTSFSVMQLVEHVETLAGGPVDLETREPEVFYTLRGLRTLIDAPVPAPVERL